VRARNEYYISDGRSRNMPGGGYETPNKIRLVEAIDTVTN
jgi:hypothetical protein